MTNRLNTILSFIEKKDLVADIGCDHAKLAINLKKNNLCKSVCAVDINEKALDNAKKNIVKERLDIPIFLSDGLTCVDMDIDTAVICGLGASTILHIIDTFKNQQVKKIIIQSNNNLKLLRKKLLKKGFYLKKEKVIYDKKHYYVIGLYTKEKVKLKRWEIYFGLYNKNNIDYYKYLNDKLENKLKNIPLKHRWEIFKTKKELKLLKKYL